MISHEEIARKIYYFADNNKAAELAELAKSAKLSAIDFRKSDLIDGFSPLQTNKQYSMEIYKILLGAGLDINFQSSEGYTPISSVAYYGYPEIVEYFANAGARVDIVDNEGNTALHAGVRSKNPQVIKFLAQKFPELKKVKCKQGLTPLQVAQDLKLPENLLSLLR